jgi:hypothetical protein
MEGELGDQGSDERSEIGEPGVTEVMPEAGSSSRFPVPPLVFAVVFLALVIAGVVAVVNVLDDGDDEATPDVDTTGDPGLDEETAADPAGAASAESGREATGATDDGLAADVPASESASYYGGDSWLVPWADGFLDISLTYNPPPLPEITDEIAAGLPVELLDAIEVSGATTVDDVYRLIDENELWELVEGIESEDHEDPLAWMYQVEPPPPTMEIRRSSDGTSWETLDDVSIPGGESIVGVASDGAHLVVATQTWDYGDELEPPRTSMYVATTSDLEAWDIHELPSADPGSVPEHVQLETGLGGVAIGDAGWLALGNTWAWLDEWSLLSGVLGDTGEGWNTRADESGLTVEIYAPFDGEFAEDTEYGAVDETGDAVEGEEGDVIVDGGDDAVYPAVHPEELECCEIAETLFLGWDDLGVDYATWQQYHEGEGGGTTTTWTATWGADPVETVLETDIELGSVVGSDSGFVALGWGRREGGTNVLFSEDGRTWVERSSPAEGAGIWIDSIAAVDGGIVATGSTEYAPGTLVWQATSDATDWELVDVPGLDADTWFGLYSQASSPGVAAFVDLADYSIHEPPPVEVDLEIEYDGFMITTDQMPDGGSSVLITEIATGEVVLDAASDLAYPQEVPEYLVLDDEGVAFIDPGTGDVIVEMPADEIMSYWQPAYEAALAEAGWAEPTEEAWQGDFWLLATGDGSNWLFEELPDVDGEPWPQTAAINGDVVVARLGATWSTFNLS